MSFKEGDLVVITGSIVKTSRIKFNARIFEVLVVGLQNLLVVPHDSKYSKEIVKVKKESCTKIIPKKQLNDSMIEPKIGSLVLVYETDWKGNITKKFVGHIEEIHEIPGKPLSYVILSNNKRIEANIKSILLLEI